MKLLRLALKWINLALSQTWLLVAGAFGALVLYAKLMGSKAQSLKTKNKTLDTELKKAERIQNVKTTSTRDDALERLSKHGDVRKD